MKYIEYRVTDVDETQAEILIAELAEAGFDSFSEYDFEERAVSCFVTEDLENKAEIEPSLSGLKYTRAEIEQQNWNALWESGFDPISVGERCYIRATFHEPREVEHEIVITPKMSFGTGHHPTTHLVVELMLEENFEGQQGLDMGSGTGILAILAAQRGAILTDAVDIDEWAYENCIENIDLNGVETAVCPILGDVSAIGERMYDFILANINRNILMRDMPQYVATLRNGGFLIVSGILEMDVEAITTRAQEIGLAVDRNRTKDGWAAIKFYK